MNASVLKRIIGEPDGKSCISIRLIFSPDGTYLLCFGDFKDVSTSKVSMMVAVLACDTKNPGASSVIVLWTSPSHSFSEALWISDSMIATVDSRSSTTFIYRLDKDAKEIRAEAKFDCGVGGAKSLTLVQNSKPRVTIATLCDAGFLQLIEIELGRRKRSRDGAPKESDLVVRPIAAAYDPKFFHVDAISFRRSGSSNLLFGVSRRYQQVFGWVQQTQRQTWELFLSHRILLRDDGLRTKAPLMIHAVSDRRLVVVFDEHCLTLAL